MNSQNSFSDIFFSHTEKVSAKWESYLPLYDRIFSPFKDQRVSLLEIGIQNGGSLEIWAKYFDGAEKIIGCDTDLKCADLKFSHSNIELVTGNILDDSVANAIREKSATYQIIVDDASHKSRDIIATFLRLFPSLDQRGVYLIEDLHCSYWKEYQGGLYDPHSSISFFKKLIDVVNRQHWGNRISIQEYMDEFSGYLPNQSIAWDELSKIDSIEFVNSVCIIRKHVFHNQDLGRLLVTGHEELVTPMIKEHYVNQGMPEFLQLDNPFASKKVHLAGDSHQRDELIHQHLDVLIAKNHELAQLYYESSLRVIDLEKKLSEKVDRE